VRVLTCDRCGGGGFSEYGTGYDDVCSDCGGTGLTPEHFWSEEQDRAVASGAVVPIGYPSQESKDDTDFEEWLRQ
jgi:hypothetical protein